jgi:hypothetical protein
MTITITHCDVLRSERHQMLAVIADEHAHSRERRYLRKLIHHRLQEIAREMESADCPQHPDEGEYMDIARELDEEARQEWDKGDEE